MEAASEARRAEGKITVSVLGPLDWGPVLGGYLVTLALASAYIAIGLFVSSRTDNQIVSLIVTALICGTFYVLGSDALTSPFGNDGGEVLRLIGSGSRFNSIARGVIDFRDIYYYLSILGVFLVLNLYSLESLRWSAQGQTKKHSQWRLAAGLLVANLVAGNLWLGQLTWARADLTSGSIYSISSETRSYLQQLQEPRSSSNIKRKLLVLPTSLQAQAAIIFFASAKRQSSPL